jgi:AAHS family 4-hydroxybenzoate transporter-like MFS transporter
LLSLEYRRTTIGIWAIYLLSWIAWFLLLLWLPTALTTLALKKSTAALGTVTVNGAFIIMAIPLSTLLPKLDPRVLLLAMFASGVVIAIMVGLSGANWTLLFILIALAGFGIGGQQLVLN